jgi:hypothetical protein
MQFREFQGQFTYLCGIGMRVKIQELSTHLAGSCYSDPKYWGVVTPTLNIVTPTLNISNETMFSVTLTFHGVS